MASIYPKAVMTTALVESYRNTLCEGDIVFIEDGAVPKYYAPSDKAAQSVTLAEARIQATYPRFAQTDRGGFAYPDLYKWNVLMRAGKLKPVAN